MGRRQALVQGWPEEHTRTLLTDRAITDPHGAIRQAAVQALVHGWPDEHTQPVVLAVMVRSCRSS